MGWPRIIQDGPALAIAPSVVCVFRLPSLVNARIRRIGLKVLRPVLMVIVLGGIRGFPLAAWAQEELFVANDDVVTSINHSITVYARTASGNTTPLRTLSGVATGLDGPVGLVVDSVNSELVVANSRNNSITVYARTASGNTVPLRTLSGLLTGLSGPSGLAVDTVNNELVAVNRFSESLTVYARTASGNFAPLGTLQGPATGLSSPIGLAVDLVNNELVVGNSGNASLTVYARTASGNAAPLRTLQGPATGLSFPEGFAVDPVNDELLVVNGTNNSVTVYARTASGNAAPLRTLQGPATGLSSPRGLALDLANNELLATSVSGSVTVYARTASGNAAPLRTLSGVATGLNGPQFLAVTTSAGAGSFVNLSTRGLVQTGDNVMIGGFVIGGTTPKTVLIRALGPSLTAFGVPGVLADPTLQLFSGQSAIAENNDWETPLPLCAQSGQACGTPADIAATGLAPSASLEAAILITLNPGPYTAIVSGVGGTTGVGLVEVFEVPGP